MSTSRARCPSLVATLVAATLSTLGAGRAFAAPGAAANGSTSTVGSYTRYTRRLEDEAVRVLTPEIGGTSKAPLAAHGLDLWGCMTISEWRQQVLRHAPSADKALTVLVRRTEVLWAEENVTDPYGSTILQLGSVHAMQRGLSRVLEALGVAAPAPVSAIGLGSGAPIHLPTAPSTALFAPSPAPATPVGRAARPFSGTMSVSPDSAYARPVPTPALVHTAPPIPTPTRVSAPMPVARRSQTPVAVARPIPAAQSPYELAAYQGTLARESYRVLFPEVESGAQLALAPKRAEMRNASTVAEWKRLLTEANPLFAKAAAVLERRAEVLRGETNVLDAYDSPHTQRAAVFGLQQGLEKILALYGK